MSTLALSMLIVIGLPTMAVLIDLYDRKFGGGPR
jgi:hypothetical protein